MPAPEPSEAIDGHVFRTRAERYGKKRDPDGVVSRNVREGMSL